MALKLDMNSSKSSSSGPIVIQPMQSATPSVTRAACILDLLAKASSPVSLAELSKMLAMPKSSLHTICATLIDLRLIRKMESGHMTLGPHVMNWANAFLSRNEITREFYSVLDEDDVSPLETITLSILDDTNVIYIACRNGARPLGVTFRIGMRLPAPFTATGKAMLSTYSLDEVKSRFTRCWPTELSSASTKSLTALLAQFRGIKETGYSFDPGEVQEGMVSFGAPIFDSSGSRAVAARAISMLKNDLTLEKVNKFGNEAKKLANSLSCRLGARL